MASLAKEKDSLRTNNNHTRSLNLASGIMALGMIQRWLEQCLRSMGKTGESDTPGKYLTRKGRGAQTMMNTIVVKFKAITDALKH